MLLGFSWRPCPDSPLHCWQALAYLCINMAKSPSSLSRSTLAGTGFLFNFLSCLGCTAQNADLQKKPLNLISYLYLYHLSSGTTLNLLIADSLLDEYHCLLYCQLMRKKKNNFFSSFSSCSFLECFLFLIVEKLSLVGSFLYSYLCFSWKSFLHVGLNSFQFCNHLCHYGSEMCGALLLEPLEHQFPVGFDCPFLLMI